MNSTQRLEILRFHRFLERTRAVTGEPVLFDNPGRVEVVPDSPTRLRYNYVYESEYGTFAVFSRYLDPLPENSTLKPFARVLSVAGQVIEVDLVDKNGDFPEQRAEKLRQANLAAQGSAPGSPNSAADCQPGRKKPPQSPT